ncbi:hypothetical protein [Streptantibioticus ferralitis]|uniref:Uncharacterized protein n=1 Tax=Streptantibioticus ferralitis TaxID=236510 RepID=A0ABT5Z5N4_9ACTN|nr:hypothetical protein [Streptantibioticus ferralitis]MDF2259135.1 hypothetical protein [Streptantibioticus ferralitis]
MPGWGLIVERNSGWGERAQWQAEVVGHVDGTREQALEEPRVRATEHARSQSSVRLCRHGDAFPVTRSSGWSDRHSRWSVAELVRDSEAEREAAARRQEEKARGAGRPLPLPKPPGPAPPPRIRTSRGTPTYPTGLPGSAGTTFPRAGNAASYGRVATLRTCSSPPP